MAQDALGNADTDADSEEGLVDADVDADAGDTPVLVDDADASDNVPVDADAVNVLADAENVVDAVYLPAPGCRCPCGSPRPGDLNVPDVGVSRKC